jgi:hypothetical protein
VAGAEAAVAMRGKRQAPRSSSPRSQPCLVPDDRADKTRQKQAAKHWFKKRKPSRGRFHLSERFARRQLLLLIAPNCDIHGKV